MPKAAAQFGLFDMPLFTGADAPKLAPPPAATIAPEIIPDDNDLLAIPGFCIVGTAAHAAAKARGAGILRDQTLAQESALVPPTIIAPAVHIDTTDDDADAVQAAIATGATTGQDIATALPQLDAEQINAAIKRLKARKNFAAFKAKKAAQTCRHHRRLQ